MTEGRVLYHYTDESAAISILRGGGLKSSDVVIWASDALYLNDSREVLAGREPLKQGLERYARRRSEEAREGVATGPTANLEQAISVLSEEIDRFGEDGNRPARVFVSCFCEEPDLLSQWRGYGRGGYSLGFDATELERSASPHDFDPPERYDFYSSPIPVKVKKVLYTDSELNDAIAEDIWPVLQPAAGGLRGWQSYGPMQLLQTVARIKHKSFSSEQEWRLIYVRRGGILGSLNSELPQNRYRPAAQIRPSANAPVPYIPMAVPRSAIRSIRVGPGGDMRLRRMAMQRFCEDLDLNVEVQVSDVPYRGQ